MLEWIISSSVIMLIVILLRSILQGKISPKFQYALWTVVLIRLLVPVSFFQSSISIMNVLPQSTVSKVTTQMETPVFGTRPHSPTTNVQEPGNLEIDVQRPSNNIPEGVSRPQTNNKQSTEQSGENTTALQTPVTASAELSWKHLFLIVWAGGSIIMAVVFILTNFKLDKRLKENRRRTRATRKLPSYVTDQVATPCLFGLKRPVIYLTAETEDEITMSHVLAHELTHYKHKDHIWAVLRCICLCLHWYNPLVWVSALLSKRDAELACDEATIKSLGDKERYAYGETLIRMTCAKLESKDMLLTATTMSLGKRTLKERIRMIVKNPKTAVVTIIAVILILSVAVGCTYAGAAGTKNASDPIITAPQDVPNQAATPTGDSNTVIDDSQYTVEIKDCFDASQFDSGEEAISWWVLTGKDANGKTVWTHETKRIYVGEGTGGLQEIGIHDGIYYYTAEDLVALDMKTGKILWQDDTFEWRYTLHVFDDSGNLCLFDEQSPLLYVVDRNGRVLKLIGRDDHLYNGEFIWNVSKMELKDGKIVFYFGYPEKTVHIDIDWNNGTT